MMEKQKDIQKIIDEMDKELKELNYKIDCLKKMYNKINLYQMMLLETLDKEK